MPRDAWSAARLTALRARLTALRARLTALRARRGPYAACRAMAPSACTDVGQSHSSMQKRSAASVASILTNTDEVAAWLRAWGTEAGVPLEEMFADTNYTCRLPSTSRPRATA